MSEGAEARPTHAIKMQIMGIHIHTLACVCVSPVACSTCLAIHGLSIVVQHPCSAHAWPCSAFEFLVRGWPFPVLFTTKPVEAG